MTNNKKYIMGILCFFSCINFFQCGCKSSTSSCFEELLLLDAKMNIESEKLAECFVNCMQYEAEKDRAINWLSSNFNNDKPKYGLCVIAMLRFGKITKYSKIIEILGIPDCQKRSDQTVICQWKWRKKFSTVILLHFTNGELTNIHVAD